MEMMNRAIEDASDFQGFRDTLLREALTRQAAAHKARSDEVRAARRESQELPAAPALTIPSKRPGENRQQYRARIFGKVSA